MGLLRLLLALSVVLGHASNHTIYGFELINGAFAVEAFFMLSGFYMALVLDHTYRGADAYWVFIQNRVMRLYPMYWLILILMIPLVLIGSWYVELPQPRPDVIVNYTFLIPELLDFPSVLLLLVSQLTFFGQDLVYFMIVESSGMFGIWDAALHPNWVATGLPLFRYLFVPQAWSLSMEMLFYLLAPMLVRRSTVTIAVLTALSIGLRLWMGYSTDLLAHSSWMYKFVPIEFWTFTLGILMYRAYQVFEARDYPLNWSIGALAALLGVGLLAVYIPFMNGRPLFVVIAVLVPLAFPIFNQQRELGPTLRRAIRIDRFVGDLSYPVYISHIFVLVGLYTLFPRTLPSLGAHLTPVFVITSLVFAAALVKFVGDPIDRIRARNRDRLGADVDRAARRRETRADQRRGKRTAGAGR